MAEQAESERQRRATQTQRVVEANLQAGLDSIASNLEGSRRFGTVEFRFRTLEELMEAFKSNRPDLSDDALERIANLTFGIYDKNLERLKTLEEVMEAFKKNQPDLSDDDVERIANRVVERLAEDFELPHTSSSRAERFRKSAHDIAIGVIGGLITTGVLDLITYFSHGVGVHAAPADEDPSKSTERALQRSRDQSIQQRLLEGLDQRRLYLFEHDYDLRERLGQVTSESLIKAVQDTEVVDDMAKFYSPEDRKKAARFDARLFVDRLWFTVVTEVDARVAPKDLSPRPLLPIHIIRFKGVDWGQGELAITEVISTKPNPTAATG